MRILVLNGPNLNLLGLREPDLYGTVDYPSLLKMIQKEAEDLGIEVRFVQSNHEGDLVDAVQQARFDCDGILLNPGAYTHTSIALLDALRAVNLPAAEVHLTDIAKREPFRRVSYAGMACQGHFIGKGTQGYLEGLRFLKEYIQQNRQ